MPMREEKSEYTQWPIVTARTVSDILGPLQKMISDPPGLKEIYKEYFSYNRVLWI